MLKFSRIIPILQKTSRNCYVVKTGTELQPKNFTLSKELSTRIKASGPITIADYMRQILTHPLGGYYIHKDGIGETGDFITSPELNQMFGEMIAIWFINEWSKLGSPKPFQIVELGPGRGSLISDVLRVFAHFEALGSASLNLVEISPIMSDLQAKRLCLQTNNIENNIIYKEGITHQGIPVKWFKHLDGVPTGVFTLLIAHEFFDALPIHKFIKTEHGYREVLIDISPENEEKFRYIVAKEHTPMSKLFVRPSETRDHLEVCPEGLSLMETICKRVESDGGLALIADYGHFGDKTDTFRAFKKHALHDPLIDPGSADLTADVDFSALKLTSDNNDGVITLGPISQKTFLLNMGIEHRFNALAQKTSNKEQLEIFKKSYNMIINDMGTRFKFFGLLPKTVEKIIQKFPVVGFNPIINK